jgi:hypothetical protein
VSFPGQWRVSPCGYSSNGKYSTITHDDEVKHLREAFGAQLQLILASSRVSAGGAFTDGRSGFFVLEVENAEDVFQLLGPRVLDHFHVETHPLMTLEKLGSFLARQVEA